eukprot:25657_1
MLHSFMTRNLNKIMNCSLVQPSFTLIMIRKDLYANVVPLEVVSLPERVQKEIKQLAPDSRTIKIIAAPREEVFRVDWGFDLVNDPECMVMIHWVQEHCQIGAAIKNK